MTLLHYYDGSLVTGAVQLSAEHGISAHAELGQVDTLELAVDDPTGVLDFKAFKTWKMVEDAAPAGNQVVWYGFVWDVEIGRGDDDALFPQGTGRRWYLTLNECNGFLSRRVLRGGDANRPKETDNARITWLLTQPGLIAGASFVGILDHGHIETSGAIVDARDYQGLFTIEVLRDCALQSGFNFFVRYREASSDMELFYVSPSSANDTASLTITNTAPNLSTSWPPDMETRLSKGASRIAAGVWLKAQGFIKYKVNGATEAEFGIVDQISPSPQVTSGSVADTLVDRFLATHNEAEQRVNNVQLQVPAAKINDVKQGQLISSVTMTHFATATDPGWTTGKQCRVLSKSISRPPNRAQAVYDVLLDLVPICASGIVHFSQITKIPTTTVYNFNFTSTSGDLLILCIAKRSGSYPASLTGWTNIQLVGPAISPHSMAVYAKISTGDSSVDLLSDVGLHGYVYEIVGATVAGISSTYLYGSTFGDTPVLNSVTTSGGTVIGFFTQNNDAGGGGVWHYNLTADAASFDANEDIDYDEFCPFIILTRLENVSGSFAPSITVARDTPLPWTTEPPFWYGVALAVNGTGC